MERLHSQLLFQGLWNLCRPWSSLYWGRIPPVQLAHSSEDVRRAYLTIAPHTKKLNGNQSYKQRDNPSTIVDARRSWPVVNNVASSWNFKRKDGQPTDRVLPTASKTKGGIDKATNVHGEGPIDRIHDRQFCEGLHHEVARVLCQFRRGWSDAWQTYTMRPKDGLALTLQIAQSKTNQRSWNQEAQKQVHPSEKHYQNQRTSRHQLHHH